MEAGDVTNAEYDGVGQVNILEKKLLGWLLVLKLQHRENEVGDDEEKHTDVESN